MSELLTLASFCAGIGGIDAGFEREGFITVQQVEIDKNCNLILNRHFPHADRTVKDISKANRTNLRPFRVAAGGTPCTGFSLAGLRKSLKDERSNLCLQYVRVLDETNPDIIVWENVPGCLSTEDNAFGCFLAAIVGADTALVPPRSIKRWRVVERWPDCTDQCKNDEGGGKRKCGHSSVKIDVFSWPNAGMVAGPKRTAAWRVFDSQYLGVAQRRERVFLVADTLGGCSPEILFESEGLRRNYPPSREEGQTITGTLEIRTKGGGGISTDFAAGGGWSSTSPVDYNRGGGQ